MSSIVGKPVVLVAVTVAVIVAGAAAFMLMGGGGAETTTTTSTTTTTTTTTTQPAGQAALEGYWHGTYKSQSTASRGEFCFRLVKAGAGYAGTLAINDEANVYVGTGIPVAITVSGNQITMGWVAGPSVTFSGTISGNTMEGTWQISGGQYSDHGTWSASKGKSSMCEMLEATTTTPAATSTTSPASPQEYYDSVTDLKAVGDLAAVDGMIRQLLSNVFGGAKLAVQGQTTSGMKAVYVVPRLVTADDGAALIQTLQNMGYQLGMMSGVTGKEIYITVALPDGSMLIISAGIGGQEIAVLYTVVMITSIPTTTTATETTNPYDSAPNIQASGVLAVLDPMFRQAFEQVFDGVKLEAITDSGDFYTSAVYIVPRKISYTDAEALTQALQRAGLQVDYSHSEPDYFRIYVSTTINGSQYNASIEFGGPQDPQRLEVYVEKTPSPQELYNAAEDQQPLGVLAEVDPAIRAVLSEVFGGVKLVEQGSYGTGAYGEYIVPRLATEEDATAIVQLLPQYNFTNVFPQIDSDGAYIMAVTGSYTVTIQFYFDSQTIEVMVMA